MISGEQYFHLVGQAILMAVPAGTITYFLTKAALRRKVATWVRLLLLVPAALSWWAAYWITGHISVANVVLIGCVNGITWARIADTKRRLKDQDSAV